MAKGEELFDTAATYVAGRAKAAELAGIRHGDELVDFVSDVGPQSGKILGRQTSDGLRGFRLDWDPSKGFHLNWWDRTGGAKRADWLYGAVEVPGKTWQDYIELIQHGVTF